jgi:hypothetical protein
MNFLFLDLLPIGACVLDGRLYFTAWNQRLESWSGIGRD